MTVEKLIKRTIWKAKCPTCGTEVIKEDGAPRARNCCGGWVDYTEESVIGPDLGLPGYK
jgi:hypothetical protein